MLKPSMHVSKHGVRDESDLWTGGFSCFSCTSASAFAEGNCPPGNYPTGGQGTPSGEWLTRWGAVVQSPTSDLVGTSANKTSEAAAESEARRICESEGARDCRTSLTYYNQCVAFSVPSSGKGRGSVNTAVDLDTAKKNALASCSDTGGARCAISHTECSEPVFQAY
ncbi:MAG TPA: hypothetical protein DEA38_17455 [Stenotrophomonas sp.]|nr:hypothetical protein [Stenotrophomonas sp.]